MKNSSPSHAARFPLWCSTTALMLALLAPAPAASQVDPKSQPNPPPAPLTPASILTPHPGMVILGQIVVGQSAPDFELDGSRGKPVRLSSLRGDWVLMVFADRKDSIAALAREEAVLRGHGIRFVGVCREKAHTIETFAARSGAQYLLLADVTGEVSAMYGLWDRVISRTLPGFILVDPRGIVHIALEGRPVQIEQLMRIVVGAVEGT